MKVKKSFQPTEKLASVHWLPLKPHDTKETIWYSMDDENLLKELDLPAFEEQFKLEPIGLKMKTRKESTMDR